MVKRMQYLSVMLMLGCLVGNVLGNIFIAARSKNGIVIASDRTPFALNKNKSSLRPISSGKIMIPLTDDIVMAVVEGTSKFHKLYRDLRRFVKEYNLLIISISGNSAQNIEADSTLDIYSVAKVARRLIYEKYPKEHIVLAGYSKISESYCLYEVLPHGTLVHCDYVVGGSGGHIAHSMMNELYDIHSDERHHDTLTHNKIIDNEENHSAFDPFSKPESGSMLKSGRYFIGAEAGKLPIALKDVLPVVKRAVKFTSSLDHHSTLNNIDLWVLDESQSDGNSNEPPNSWR